MSSTLVPMSLPKFNYLSMDEEALAAHMGARLVDTYIDEVGAFRKRPGLSLWCDLGTSASVDGLFWSESFNKVIAVSGGNIYSCVGGSSAGTSTDVTGDTLNTTRKVSFIDDGTYIFMANGGEIVTYDNTNPTDKMSDIETGPGTAPTTVSAIAFLDSYLIALGDNSSTFYYTDPTDRLSWTNTDLYNEDYEPDDAVWIDVQDREITVFGKSSIGTWWNDGSSPFSRIQSALYDVGVKAPESVVKYKGGYLFLDSNYKVSYLNQRQLTEVSMPIDSVLSNLLNAEDGRAFLVPKGNRIFYVITFNADNRTLAFDLTTNGWAEWGTWNSSNNNWDRFGAWTYCFAANYNIHLVGGFGDGKIYKLDMDTYTDNGAEIRSIIRTAPQTYGTFNRKRCNALRIRLKRNSTSDDELRVRWRDDRNNQTVVWSAEKRISLGTSGQDYMFAKLNNLGSYRARQWEFIHSDDSAFTLVACEEEIEGGMF